VTLPVRISRKSDKLRSHAVAPPIVHGCAVTPVRLAGASPASNARTFVAEQTAV
jgi:hypothetical protein